MVAENKIETVEKFDDSEGQGNQRGTWKSA